MYCFLLQVSAVAALGITVITTFIVCWLPFLGSMQEAVQVNRGAALALVCMKYMQQITCLNLLLFNL